MKCQSCDNQATLHVTELVNGQPTEFHVCEAHFDDLDKLKAAMERQSSNSLMAFLGHPGIREAMGDPEARKKVAAHLLPALCLALLDPKPEVKVIAIYHLMMLGPDAQSAIGALQDACQDPNEGVRHAAGLALKIVEGKEDCPWLMR
jgi:HEAT repeat protein